MPKLSDRVNTFTDSVIRRMTRISNQYGAINLSQGFPDFDPPKAMLDALAKVSYKGPHQYAVTFGAQNFREALARKQEKAIRRKINPNTEIVVTCGGTEAMMSAMMTICNPGDKVMVFSPFYENYGADAILSGAEPIYIPLVPPTYEFDIRLVEEGFKAGAKAIIVCNPSNPCGKVFTRELWEMATECPVVFPDGKEFVVRGTCEGTIAFELTGDGGFGYDPIFLVGEQSFGQLSDEEKDRISHRGKALMLFSQKLQEYLNN